jgi:prolyl 4-hydroxylase
MGNAARMPDRSIEVLRHAAGSGDVLAMTRLGERLLSVSTPDAFAEAAQNLDRATRGGGIEAPAILAMMFAMGVAEAPNWDSALDLLAIGAQRGSTVAQGQLEALSGRSFQARGAADWRNLRHMIDPAAWSAPGQQRVLSRSPRIYDYPSFVPASVRAWVIRRAQGRITPALVFDPRSPGVRVEDARTNGAFAFDLVDMDVVMAVLRHRIAAMVGVASSALESQQVLHYRTGQRFEPHFDFLDPDLPGHTQDLADRGQRIVTCLIYLNDDFDGGETDFPILGLRHKPPAGGALCFVNVQPTGMPDRRTQHAGLAPTRGEKWLLSQWIRDRKAP